MNYLKYDVFENRPIFTLTVKEFKELLRSIGKEEPDHNQESECEYVYGYAGGAKLFNCSKPTFYRILKSGVISQAVKQVGKKIIIDKKMALELIQK